MDKFIQKWAIVHMLEPVERGYTFKAGEWPLHITLVSNFTFPLDSNEIVDQLSNLLVDQSPVSTVSTMFEKWGDNKDIEVTVMDTNSDLRNLHSKLIKHLESHGANFDERRYLYDGYGAHSTVQKHARLELGKVVNIDSLTLIDMFPDKNGHKRRVLDTIKL